ncbi:PfkB family carbohydrate kinase [Leptospira sp. GIMC2001]|uniref:PfkB family carbohydrate kinase n=1 Tax=Leptospira sp. GIMC2001 TaxID=1513297 RepID=UPI003FA55D02
MSAISKIKSISSQEDLNSLGSSNETVLCFGHFNVIHPGHIRFLQFAKSLNKKLLVCVLGDHLISQPEQSRYFKMMERAEGVASLHFVDEVVVLDDVSLELFIEKIKPKSLVLGSEWERKPLPEIANAIATVEKFGGKVHFQAGEVHYASADLLHSSQEILDIEKRSLFLQACKRQGIQISSLVGIIEKFTKTRILVIGDTIVDQYVACDAIGMSAEAPVLVVREMESKEFVGGAGIVAGHLKALGSESIYLSVVGNDSNAQIVEDDLKKQGVETYLIKDESRPTTFKIRYMVENQKLFRVSRMKEHSISKEIEDSVIEKLRALSDSIHGILVSDFVYGMITERILNEIVDIAKKKNLILFGDLQCSSQVGNVTKFKNFDLLTPTEREARIALSNHTAGIESVANKILDLTESRQLVIKLGSEGFISYSNSKSDKFLNKEHFPALVSNPVDVAGAGDSLLAAMSACLLAGANIMEASAIGACMAALSVQTVGNIPIQSNKLINYIRKLGE